MGLIRRTLNVATLGAVSPSSKKQRVAAQTLAAVQGTDALGFPAGRRPGRWDRPWTAKEIADAKAWADGDGD